MNKSQMVLDQLQKSQLIALLAPQVSEHCLMVYEALAPLGITMEIALRTQVALDGIRATLKKHPDALLLAGTVMTRQQAELAIDAGAAGVVSADYIPAVVEYCVNKDVMCVPGGIADAGKQLSQKAMLYQCDFQELAQRYPYQWIYKLFPAVTENVSFMDLAGAWRGPYKDLTVIYTGGLNIKNLAQAVKKDPRGIFCGSALTSNPDNKAALQAEAQKWITIIRENKLI